MPKKSPSKTTEQTSPIPPSDELVSSFLRRLRNLPRVEEKTMDQWQSLEKNQPNVARFIMACSYRAAPDDPDLRAVIAANMLYLYILLGEAELQEEVSQSFAEAFGDYSTAHKN